MEFMAALCIGLLLALPSWAGLILWGVAFWPSVGVCSLIFAVAFCLTVLASVAVRVGS